VVVWLANGISWWHDSFSLKKCSKKTIATLHGMNLEPSRKEVSPVASCQLPVHQPVRHCFHLQQKLLNAAIKTLLLF
jgi:hypothetical protein